jgi:hypothetical protein
VAAHILCPFGIRPIMDTLAAGQGGRNHDIGIGSDNLFIHMTGMSQFDVETVIVAGKIRKWKGKLLGFDIPGLRRQLENSRDYVFAAAGVAQDLFSSQ